MEGPVTAGTAGEGAVVIWLFGANGATHPATRGAEGDGDFHATCAGIYLMQPGAESDAQVIRPQHNRQHAAPERQMEQADREEPSAEPKQSNGAVLLDPYALHESPGCRNEHTMCHP